MYEERAGNWLNVGVEGSAVWPKKETVVSFEGHDLLLRPAERETEHSIHMNLVGITESGALTLINRFLSLLTWCDGQGMTNLYGWSGSPTPTSYQKSIRTIGATEPFIFTRGLEKDDRASLALGLYREARCMHGTAYEFLNYFKILNIFWPDKKKTVKGGAQVNPIVEGTKQTLPKLSDSEVSKRIAAIVSQGHEPAEYLYVSGRCAIAHAHSDPLVDPDKITDLRRLNEDMCIVRCLAEYLIKNDLGVRQTMY